MRIDLERVVRARAATSWGTSRYVCTAPGAHNARAVEARGCDSSLPLCRLNVSGGAGSGVAQRKRAPARHDCTGMRITLIRLALGLCALGTSRSDQTYVDTFLVQRLSAAMTTFLSAPVELVDLTRAAYDLDSLSAAEALREWIYAQTKAMAAKSGTSCSREVTMIYAGMQDGTFVGYYDPVSYTARAAQRSRADAPGTTWAPYTLVTINAADDVQSPPGRIVGTGCSESTSAELCEQSGCDTSGCCYSNIRTYHTTRPALRGRPENLTRWTTYDPRCRPWYTEQLWDSTSSRWSSVYESFSNECSQGADLVITRTGALRVDTDASTRGVYAIDFRLQGISQLLNNSLVGQDTWAYVVERRSLELIGITTGEPLVVSDTDTGRHRTTPHDSSSASIAQSAQAFDQLSWATTSIVAAPNICEDYFEECSSWFASGECDSNTEFMERNCLLSCGRCDEPWVSNGRLASTGTWSSAAASNARFEAASKRFTYAGADWVLVVGQDIRCADNEIWAFGVCERCPPGQVRAGDRECRACDATQQPDSNQQDCICPIDTYAAQEGNSIQCLGCSVLRGYISSLSVRASATESAWADSCPGGPINTTVICPLNAMWVHLQGQPARSVELYPCPACVASSHCLASSGFYRADWFEKGLTRHDISFVASCKPTHRDFLCAACVDGYSKLNGQCVECASINWTWIVLELVTVALLGEALLRSKIMKICIPPRQALQVFESVDQGHKGHLDADDVSNLLIRVGAPAQTKKALWDIVMLMGAREKWLNERNATLRSLPLVPVALGGLRKSDDEISDDLSKTWISRNQFVEWCQQKESHDRFGMLVFFVQTLGLITKTSPALQAAIGWLTSETLDIFNLQAGGTSAAVECNLPWCGQHPLACRVASVVVSPLLIISVVVLRVWWLARDKSGSPGLPMRWYHLQRGLLVVFRLSYAPITRTCVSIMFGCRDVVDETRWIEDLSVRCYDGTHLVLVWISAVVFVCVGILVPVHMLAQARIVQMRQKRTSESEPRKCTRTLFGCLDKVLHHRSEITGGLNQTDVELPDVCDIVFGGSVSKHSGSVASKFRCLDCHQDLWLELNRSGLLTYYSARPGSDTVRGEWRGVLDVRDVVLVYGRGKTGLALKTQEHVVQSKHGVDRDWYFKCHSDSPDGGAEQQRDTWIEHINRSRRIHNGSESSFHPNALFPRCWDDVAMSVRPQKYYWFLVILALKLIINILYLLGETGRIGFLTSLQILLCGAGLLSHFTQAHTRKINNRQEQLTYLGLVMITILMRDPAFEQQSSMSWAWGIVIVVLSNLSFVAYTEWTAKQIKAVQATRLRRALHQTGATHDCHVLAAALPTFLLLDPDDQEHIQSRLQLEGWPLDATIYSEGDVASAFYIIKDGHVQIVSTARATNRSSQTTVLGPGDCFGADALDQAPRKFQVTATALDSVVCLRLVKADFDRFWAQQTSIDNAVDRLFGCMDNDGNNWISREEIAAYILAQAHVYGNGVDEDDIQATMETHVDALMDALDKDDDGMITRDELRINISKLPRFDIQLLDQNGLRKNGLRAMEVFKPALPSKHARSSREVHTSNPLRRTVSDRTQEDRRGVHAARRMGDHAEARPVTSERLYDEDDANGSGGVSLDELTATVSRLGLQLSARYIAGVFSAFDVDRSGELNREEFGSLMTVLVQKATPAPAPKAPPPLPRMQATIIGLSNGSSGSRLDQSAGGKRSAPPLSRSGNGHVAASHAQPTGSVTPPQ